MVEPHKVLVVEKSQDKASVLVRGVVEDKALAQVDVTGIVAD